MRWSERCARSGSTRCWSAATSMTAPCRRSMPCSSVKTRWSGCVMRAPGSSSSAAIMIRPPGSASARRWSMRPGCTCAPIRHGSGPRCCSLTRTDEVGVYALPYLEPESARVLLPADPQAPAEPIGRGPCGCCSAPWTACAADRAARGLSRAVVMGHAWVAGGAASESERDISVGGCRAGRRRASSTVSITSRSGICTRRRCSARRSATAARRWRIRSASRRQRKGSWLVELDALGRRAGRAACPAPVPRQLSSIRGRLDELLSDPTLGGVEARLPLGRADRSRPSG